MNIKITKFIIITTLFLLQACSNEEQQQPQPLENLPVKHISGDSIKGETLSADCVSCHGPNGASSKEGAPFIAGQKPDYFKSAMLDYRSAKRTHEDMQKLAANLDESMINDLSAYYSSLTTAWDPTPYRPKAKPTVVITRADIAAGKALSKSCVGCHGETGNSALPGIPSLAGLQPAYLVSALDAYFSDERQEPIMRNFKHAINKQEMNKLAAYFNTLNRVAANTTSKGNSKKGQAIADSQCSGCHGPSGNSANATMPSLSGQNSDYLVKALTAYKNGTRKNKMMQDAIKDVSTKSFINLAAYYESQTPERYDPNQKPAESGFDPIGQGEKLAQSCNGCHGKNGNSANVGIPSLSRLHPDYLKSAIASYIDGTRKHDLMQSFVKALSEDDIEKISLYYATQEPVSSGLTVKGDIAAAEEHVKTCNGCHGENGNSSQSKTPTLAGQNPSYIVAALKDYQSGKRKQQDMQNAIKDLKGADFNNIAAYYATQQAVKPEINIPAPPEILSTKCNRCHGENGFSAALDIPRIGGQIESYLLESLLKYRNKQRDHAVMFAMADALSILEMKAIAKYYSDQKQ